MRVVVLQTSVKVHHGLVGIYLSAGGEHDLGRLWTAQSGHHGTRNSARWPIPLFRCCPGASLRASPIKVLEPRTRRYLMAGNSSTLLHWNRWSEDGTILTPGAGIIRPLDIIGTTSGGTKWKTLQWQMPQRNCIASCWTSSWNEWEKMLSSHPTLRYQTFANSAVQWFALVT